MATTYYNTPDGFASAMNDMIAEYEKRVGEGHQAKITLEYDWSYVKTPGVSLGILVGVMYGGINVFYGRPPTVSGASAYVCLVEDVKPGYHDGSSAYKTFYMTPEGNIQDTSGNIYDPVTGDAPDTELKVKKEFDNIAEINGFTPEELEFAFNSLLALAIGGFMGGAVLAGAGLPAAIAIGIHGLVLGGIANWQIDKYVSENNQIDTSTLDIPINIGGTRDVSDIIAAAKAKQLVLPVSNLGLDNARREMAEQLIDKYSVPPEEIPQVKQEIEHFYENVFAASKQNVTDNNTGKDRQVINVDQFQNAYNTEIDNMTTNIPKVREILENEATSHSTPSKEFEKYISGNGDGTYDSTGFGDLLAVHGSDLKQGYIDNDNNVSVKVSSGGGGVDLSGVIGALNSIKSSVDTVSTTIAEKPVPITKFQEQQAVIKAGEEYGYEVGITGDLEKKSEGVRDIEGHVATKQKEEYAYEVDGKQKIEREGEAWREEYSKEVLDDFTDGMGNVSSIPIGNRVDVYNRTLIREQAAHVSGQNIKTIKKHEAFKGFWLPGGTLSDIGTFISEKYRIKAAQGDIPETFFEDLQEIVDTIKRQTVQEES